MYLACKVMRLNWWPENLLHRDKEDEWLSDNIISTSGADSRPSEPASN